MRATTEIGLGVGALLALQLLTSAAAIGLLSRVAPAVDRVLRENDVSLQAAEEAVAVLADPPPDARERYRAALATARNNITVEAERPVVARLSELEAAAFEPGGRAAAVAAWQDLTRINREAMRTANAEARALGFSGAWAAVLLGAAGFGLGLFITVRLTRRIAAPITELDDTVSAARRGDAHRRCATLEGPDEVRRLALHVNALLDDRAPAATRLERLDDARVFAQVFDLVEDAILLLGPDLRVEASNQASLEPDVPAASAAIEALRQGEEPPDGWEARAVGGRTLLRFRRRGSGASEGPAPT